MNDDKISDEDNHEEAVSSPKLFDIRERAFAFAVRIIKLCKFLEKHRDVSKNVISQLLDAGTSVGANLEEAKAAQSRADFIHKNNISLKEARESSYWLKLILATEKFDESVERGIKELENESLELANIIGKIITSTKK
jgi:four helix bundle protein